MATSVKQCYAYTFYVDPETLVELFYLDDILFDVRFDAKLIKYQMCLFYLSRLLLVLIIAIEVCAIYVDGNSDDILDYFGITPNASYLFILRAYSAKEFAE